MAPKILESTSWLSVLLVYLCFTDILAVHLGLYFTAEPRDVTVEKGTPLEMPCSAGSDHDGPIDITWRKDGKLLKLDPKRRKNPRITVLPTGALLFTKTRRKRNVATDEGVYECVANNSYGALISQQALLQFTSLGRFTAEPRNTSVVVGQWASFHCLISGVPSPQILWYKDMKLLNEIDGRYVMLTSGTLQIHAVNSTYVGFYFCDAINPQTHDLDRSREAYLNVLPLQPGPSQVTLFPQYPTSQVVQLHERKILECYTKGIGSPRLVWYRGGETLTLGGRIRLIGQGSLLINPVKMSDTGEYTCAVEGDTQSVSVSLKVVEVPYIIQLTENSFSLLSFAPGETLRLTCHFGGTPEPNVTWFFNADDNIHDRFGRRHRMDGHILILEHLSDADSGYYQCKADNGVGVNYHTHYVNISGEPIEEPRIGLFFEEEPADVIVDHARELVLPCRANSSDAGNISITWQHGGDDLDLYDSRIIVEGSGTLYLRPPLLESDAGRYVCVARNDRGSVASQPATLTFASLGMFIKEPENRSVVAGHWASLQCYIIGLPSPIVSWYKDMKPLNNTHLRYIVLPSGTLQIRAVDSSDTGFYHCVAFNTVLRQNKSSQRAYLTVQPQHDGSPVAISLLPAVSNTKEAIRNRSVLLECYSVGLSSYAINWSKSGSLLKLGGRFSVVGQGSLHISGVQMSDSGGYTCSMDGVLQTVSFRLVVLETPYLQSVQTEFPQSDSVEKVCLNYPLQLTCEFGGTPLPMVEWHFNAVPVQHALGMRYRIVGSQLFIDQLQRSDEGYYQCRATNDVGFLSHTMFVQVLDRLPAVPQQVEVLNVTSTSASFRVSPVHPAVIAYSVHYKPEGGILLDKALNPENQKNSLNYFDFTLSLNPFTRYTIYLMVYNNECHSTKSPPFSITTDQAVPSVVPALTVRATSPTSFLAEWEHLTVQDATGILTGHYIFYKLSHEDTGTFYVDKQIPKNISIPSELRSFVVTGLEREMSYDVLVISGTKAGFPDISRFADSWQTAVLPQTVVGSVPDPPWLGVYNLDGNSVEALWHMSWEGGPQGSQSVSVTEGMCTEQLHSPVSPLLSFELTVAALHVNGRTEIRDRIPILQPERRRHVIQNLEEHTLYKISLVASNIAGTGSPVWQAIRTARMSVSERKRSRKPPPPSLVMSTVQNESSIFVQWIPPTWQPHDDLSYRIKLRSIPIPGSLPVITHMHIEKEGAVITDLTPFTKYEISVQAVSNGAMGPFNKPGVICQTFQGVPSAPRNIQGIMSDITTVHLSWLPPSQPNGLITGYIVFYTSDPKSPFNTWHRKELTGVATQVYIGNLQQNVVYSFQVHAKTKAGEGPPSTLIPINMQDIRSSGGTEMGIIIGLCLGLSCIIICVMIICCRNRCVAPASQVPHCACQCQLANGAVRMYGNQYTRSAITAADSPAPALRHQPCLNGAVYRCSTPPVHAVLLPNGHFVSEVSPTAQQHQQSTEEVYVNRKRTRKAYVDGSEVRELVSLSDCGNHTSDVEEPDHLSLTHPKDGVEPPFLNLPHNSDAEEPEQEALLHQHSTFESKLPVKSNTKEDQEGVLPVISHCSEEEGSVLLAPPHSGEGEEPTIGDPRTIEESVCAVINDQNRPVSGPPHLYSSVSDLALSEHSKTSENSDHWRCDSS